MMMQKLMTFRMTEIDDFEDDHGVEDDQAIDNNK